MFGKELKEKRKKIRILREETLNNMACNISRRFEEANWSRIENLRTGRILRILILYDIYMTSMYNIYNGKKGVTPWYFFFFFFFWGYRLLSSRIWDFTTNGSKTVLKYSNSETPLQFKEEKFVYF